MKANLVRNLYVTLIFLYSPKFRLNHGTIITANFLHVAMDLNFFQYSHLSEFYVLFAIFLKIRTSLTV